jgi:hypothetical protein
MRQKLLVPLAGIEPALLAELDFESSASTSSATGAFRRRGRKAGVAKPAEYSGRTPGVNRDPPDESRSSTRSARRSASAALEPAPSDRSQQRAQQGRGSTLQCDRASPRQESSGGIGR